MFAPRRSAAGQVLLADIGGTHSRFAVASPGGRPERIAVFANQDFTGLEAAIAAYLAEHAVHPDSAVLAVAGPVDGHEIALTNCPWRFRLDVLAERFALRHVQAINDFEALAWALPQLRAEDLRRLGPEGPAGASDSAKVVLGPGTGLGVAALVPTGDAWQSVASEGGHVSFGPDAPDEYPIFALLRARGRVSAETILSGPGLARLHAALNPQAPALAPESVVAQAQLGDRAALASTRLFVRLLGRFAGDAALIFKATGGVYLAGGVAPALGALFDEDIFRAAFEAHPPYAALLAAIPTFLITCAQPGLLGCAALAKEMQKAGDAFTPSQVR
ncbi:MAG TPA: ROK family protein [Xanthobacteraceae bacterium]|nr:ROK family protein [Xanthobacteraceae bacterium]